jgi:hypothetical protein
VSSLFRLLGKYRASVKDYSVEGPTTVFRKKKEE